MILLHVDLASGDEFEIICVENISIFAWYSILRVEHGCYRWLCGLIHQLPPNNKVDYLIHTIRHILDFLQL